MGILHDVWVAEHQGHEIEVHGDNHLLRGLVFELYIDGTKVAEGANTFKLPGKTITLQGHMHVGTTETPITVVIKQGLTRAEYHLDIGGTAVPLQQTK
jgi:hypothetical protein